MTQPVVIVNPTSSGSELAPAFAKRNVSAVAVRLAGSGGQGNGGFANKIQAENFLDVLQEQADLVETLAKLKPHAIIAGTESGVPLADHLAAMLTPKFANVHALSQARVHKALMQEALEKAGMPVIRTLNAASVVEAEAWLKKHQLMNAPLVVKPPESAGSDKVFLIPAGGDWKTPFEHILATPAAVLSRLNKTVIVQEQALGTEYAVDTVSAAGKHTLAHFMRYEKAEVSGGQKIFDFTEFLPVDTKEHRDLIKYAEDALDALGIHWGAAHCEIMLTQNGPRLIEVGSRMCGGPVLGFARAATGSSQVERVVEAYVDGKISTQNYKLNQTVVPVFLAAPVTGVLRNVEVLDQLKKLPTHLATHMWLKNGDRVKRTVDFGTTIGIVALAGKRDAVFSDYRRVREVEAQMVIDE